ncbi:putative non-specific serine/threonine protein kinase [Helianthus annuus]|nr:putative non-specific serine/threonine protein kinase [Helianthus annuus]
MKKGSLLIPFSTSFIFAMVPTQNVLPGHGFVFLFTPVTGIQNANSAQNLGLFSREVDGNSNNHVFGVEFDVFRNEEFGDNNNNHVGIDVNSLTSVFSGIPGYSRDDGGDSRTLKLITMCK